VTKGQLFIDTLYPVGRLGTVNNLLSLGWQMVQRHLKLMMLALQFVTRASMVAWKHKSERYMVCKMHFF